jgi:hypothetical protein
MSDPIDRSRHVVTAPRTTRRRGARTNWRGPICAMAVGAHPTTDFQHDLGRVGLASPPRAPDGSGYGVARKHRTESDTRPLTVPTDS